MTTVDSIEMATAACATPTRPITVLIEEILYVYQKTINAHGLLVGSTFSATCKDKRQKKGALFVKIYMQLTDWEVVFRKTMRIYNAFDLLSLNQFLQETLQELISIGYISQNEREQLQKDMWNTCQSITVGWDEGSTDENIRHRANFAFAQVDTSDGD